MRAAILLLLFAVTATIEVGEARATICSPLPGGFSPVSNTPIPARGSVYFFLPKRKGPLPGQDPSSPPVERKIKVTGATSDIHVLQRDSSATVVRVDYRAIADRVVVSADLETYHIASYPVASALAPDHAIVKTVEQRRDPTFGHDFIALTMDSTAVAYRLTWDNGLRSYVPSDFTAYYAIDPLKGHDRNLWLGRIGCVNQSIDPSRLSSPRTFQLFALYANGTEGRFPIPARIQLSSSEVAGEDPRIVVPTELLGTSAVPYTVPPLAWRFFSDLTRNLPLIALSALTIFALGFFIGHRRRNLRR